jgi:hypothetical protein
MVPDQIWRAQVDSAPKLVLIHLWSYAPCDREGIEADGGAFVWPSVEVLCSKLAASQSATYRSLRILERDGWIERTTRVLLGDRGEGRRRTGWWLKIPPAASQNPEGDVGEDSQGWESGIPKVGNEFSQGWESPPSMEDPIDPPCLPRARDKPARAPRRRKGDDDGLADAERRDASELFRKYELARVSQLGGMPTRTPSPRDAEKIRALLAYVMRRFAYDRAQAWAMVQKYATDSLRLAVEARKAGRPIATALVASRSDGSEWSPDRFDAVIARAAESPPPDEPKYNRAPAVVDEESVTDDEARRWLTTANRANAFTATEELRDDRLRRREDELRKNPRPLDDWGLDPTNKLKAFLVSIGAPQVMEGE